MRACLVLLPPLTAALCGAASAGTEVTFVAPERYTDADGTGARSREAVLAALGAEFRRLGARLPAGRDLAVEVLDIDLAGQAEPWRTGPSDLRIVSDVTPPRIRLRYVLRERGRVLASGEETLSELAFQWRPIPLASDDPLRHEKALIAGWFDRRFPPPR